MHSSQDKRNTNSQMASWVCPSLSDFMFQLETHQKDGENMLWELGFSPPKIHNFSFLQS
jgi:hypothetical protein